MKSIRRAHIVVVAQGEGGDALVARLRDMTVGQVSGVTDLATAHTLCQTGAADACVVACAEAVADAAPIPENDAPGGDGCAPSLMMTAVVTPYARQLARRRGYSAAVPASIEPRLLYRRLGAAMQKRRAAQRRARWATATVSRKPTRARRFCIAKPTLH
jgi:hypothetical protein